MKNSYFFDHNLSPKIADALVALGFDVVALSRVMPGDTPDEEWLQVVGERVVVTLDRAMKKHDIFLERGWAKLPFEVQAGKIVSCWWKVDDAIIGGRAHALRVNGKVTVHPPFTK